MTAQPAGGHDRCDALAEFGEDFDIYRSGPALALSHLPCGSGRTIVGRIRLVALVDEAAAHADTCPGPDRPVP